MDQLADVMEPLDATTAQMVAIEDEPRKQVWVLLKLANDHRIGSMVLCDGSPTKCSQIASRFKSVTLALP